MRKQIRNLPKQILNFVKKNHYYSELFTSLLGHLATPRVATGCLALWLFDGHLERRLAACDQAGELGRLLAYVGGRFTRGVPDLACETVPL